MGSSEEKQLETRGMKLSHTDLPGYDDHTLERHSNVGNLFNFWGSSPWFWGCKKSPAGKNWPLAEEEEQQKVKRTT